MNGVSSSLLSLVATAIVGAFPAAEESKEAKIHRLLEVTGAVDIEQSRNLFEAGMGQAADSLSPEVKDRVWREFVTAFPREEALARIVDVYDDVFTEGDIEGLLTFYETPLGQKVVLTQGELTARTILAFEELSTRTAREITSKLFYALEGDTLRAAGQLDAAIDSFRKAVRLYPDDPVFREILARTLAAAGRVIEARIEIDELSRLRPGTWIDAEVLPFVGLWQFETYAVWIEVFEDGRAFQCRIDPNGTVFQSEGTLRDGMIFWQQLWGIETILRTNDGMTVGKDGRENAFTVSRTPMDEACTRPASLESRRDSSLQSAVR